MSDRFEKTFEVAYPADRIWRAFSEPHEIGAWISGTVKERDIRPGGRVGDPGARDPVSCPTPRR